MGNELEAEKACEEGRRSFLSKLETAMRRGDISSGEQQQGKLLQSFGVGLCYFFIWQRQKYSAKLYFCSLTNYLDGIVLIS